jgi:hypothetical protein
MRTMHLAGVFVVSSIAVACGGANPSPSTPPTASTATTTASASTAPPPPIPIAAPQVQPAPDSCSALVEPPPAVSTEPKKNACLDTKTVLQTLASAAVAQSKNDSAARDAALASLRDCERVPLLVVDVVRAESSPMACAEAILAPALEAHGKEALPMHQNAARALVGASRMARLRPPKGAFDLLAKAEVDPAAMDASVKLLTVWRDAMEKEEGDAIALSKNAPPEIAAVVRFEIAASWLALAKEIRSTPLPDEIAALQKKDPDLPTRYLAKLDEVTMPIVDRAHQLALAGLGIAVRDGVLLKELPSFTQLFESFKSKPGFEVRKTRALDLQAQPPALPAKADATTIAATMPPWATYAWLERAEPASLLGVPVLEAMATNRGVPSALRLEVERDKKLDDAHKYAVALSRIRVALSYGSRPDVEAVGGSYKPKDAKGKLVAAIATALLGPKSSAKPGDPLATKDQSAFDLAPLDALAKSGGKMGLAAQYDAALLSLDGAELFATDETGTPIDAATQKKAYVAAIDRLDKVSQAKGIDPAQAAKAKELADGARETVKLLDKK